MVITLTGFNPHHPLQSMKASWIQILWPPFLWHDLVVFYSPTAFWSNKTFQAKLAEVLP